MVAAICGVSRGSYLENQFNLQVEAIVRRGIPAMAHMGKEAFVSLLEPLRQMIGDLDAVPNGLPFLIVVPHGMVSMPVQVALLNRGSLSARGSQQSGFTRTLSAPVIQPYLACNLSFGDSDQLGLSTVGWMAQAKRRGLSPLVLEEVLTIARIRPDIIQTAGMAAAGSRHEKSGTYVPSLARRGDTFVLDVIHEEICHPAMAFPYCQARRYQTKPDLLD